MKGVRGLLLLCLGLGHRLSYAAAKLPGEAIGGHDFIRVFGGLFLVLLFIVVLAWFVKRFNVQAYSSSKGFQPLASMSLGVREKIMLIKVGTRYLLIGIGSGSISTLVDFGEKAPEGFNLDNRPPFSEFIKSALGKN